MIRASCHCSAVVIEADRTPRGLTECNCSICRRLGVRWAYYTRKSARIVAGADDIVPYVWGGRTIEFYRCRVCGTCTHYEALGKGPDDRFTINGRCFAPEDVAHVKVRLFDGADTWKYLD